METQRFASYSEVYGSSRNLQSIAFDAGLPCSCQACFIEWQYLGFPLNLAFQSVLCVGSPDGFTPGWDWG